MLVVFQAIIRLVQNFIQYAKKEKASPEREIIIITIESLLIVWWMSFMLPVL